MRRALATLGLAVLAAGAAAALALEDGAQAVGAIDAGEPRVRARLLVHPDDAPERGRVRLGVELEIAPGWHVYDADPGEAGLPTRVALRAEGAELAPLAWPAPRELREDGIATRVHSGTLWLPSEARFEAAPAEPRVARAEIELLACGDRCIPAELSLARRLDGSADPDAERVRALFAGSAGPTDGSVAREPAPAAAAPRAPRAGLLGAVALGLLGGLLLNAMPCVLPVLAIKLAWLAELSRLGRRAAAPHALAYAAGTLAAMGALAAATLALRAGGASVGWGFQLQEPRFVAALAVVTALLAANLLGAYEIGSPPGGLARLGAGATGARRSFCDGLLAVALATPCTAPWLGAAVGFALAGSAATVLAVFAAIGVGLAAPVLAALAIPGAARALPRSGPWMLEVRRAAGLLLLATVVWLLFVLGRVAGPGAVSATLALLWLAALGAQGLGWRQRAAGRARAAATALAAAALVAASAGVVRVDGQGGAARDGARAFDAAEVAAQVASGRVAFVYFTADWCVTCKVNERLVLDDERVRAALRELDVALYRADWTRRDTAIRAELARFGRAGVPTYLVYAPGTPEPRVLPELLSVDLLLGALRDAAAS
jgi:thiol:disulfide interchange protein DsbD